MTATELAEIFTILFLRFLHSFSFTEKIYQTLNWKMFDGISKHLDVLQKHYVAKVIIALFSLLEMPSNTIFRV